MIASELNEQTVEQVRLAAADQARPPAPGRVRVLQTNVLASGQVKVRGQVYAVEEAAPSRHPSLRAFLELEAAGYDREAPEPGQGGVPLSALRVNVRADREAPFGRVQGVLDACLDQGIYKTSLAADPGPGP
jgi:biopolymer transport protein ExbD